MKRNSAFATSTSFLRRTCAGASRMEPTSMQFSYLLAYTEPAVSANVVNIMLAYSAFRN